MSGNKFPAGIDLLGTPINNIPDAISPQQPVSKAQLDAAILGLAWKTPGVRAASTANLTLSGAQTVDGVSLIAGDRVLPKNQTIASTNGIYVVSAGAWVRASDADSSAELINAAVFVSEGTANGNSVWLMTTDAPITVGVTSLTWAQIGGGTSYTQGDGITITGSVIAVDPAIVARKTGANIGDGTARTFNVAHNLASTDCIVEVREVAGTKERVHPDIVFTDSNTVTISFSTTIPAPTTGQYRVTVFG